MHYLAIQDKDIPCIHPKTKEPEDPQTIIQDRTRLSILGLYEIIRGYNIDALPYDNDSVHNKKLCEAGSFNKLVEKFAGWHPDVEIIYITAKTIMHKTRALLIDQTVKQLINSPNAATYTEDNFAETLKNAWEKIWPEIHESVTQEARIYYADRLKNKIRNNDTVKQIVAQNLDVYAEYNMLSIEFDMGNNIHISPLNQIAKRFFEARKPSPLMTTAYNAMPVPSTEVPVPSTEEVPVTPTEEVPVTPPKKICQSPT